MMRKNKARRYIVGDKCGEGERSQAYNYIIP
jgi:hypothetical protein